MKIVLEKASIFVLFFCSSLQADDGLLLGRRMKMMMMMKTGSPTLKSTKITTKSTKITTQLTTSTTTTRTTTAILPQTTTTTTTTNPHLHHRVRRIVGMQSKCVPKMKKFCRKFTNSKLSRTFCVMLTVKNCTALDR